MVGDLQSMISASVRQSKARTCLSHSHVSNNCILPQLWRAEQPIAVCSERLTLQPPRCTDIYAQDPVNVTDLANCKVLLVLFPPHPGSITHVIEQLVLGLPCKSPKVLPSRARNFSFAVETVIIVSARRQIR
jgi:hypothetical protein